MAAFNEATTQFNWDAGTLVIASLTRAGFAGYLEKPIDVENFPDQIRRFCA